MFRGGFPGGGGVYPTRPPLITTPRAVKRLTNSYGLLAAIQRQTATTAGDPTPGSDPASGGDAEVDGPAMVLLAALVGFAALGPALFTYLHRTAAQDPQETWTAFPSRLDPVHREKDRWENPAAPNMTAVEAYSWRTLLKALHDITPRRRGRRPAAARAGCGVGPVDRARRQAVVPHRPHRQLTHNPIAPPATGIAQRSRGPAASAKQGVSSPRSSVN
jgi:hypothetical protein